MSLAKDVMIDIETLGLDSHALVLSIGAIPFDCVGRDGPWFGDPFFAVPDMLEQILSGRTIERSTQLFWSAQSEQASNHWRNPLRTLAVRSALAELSDFLKDAPRIWANGIVFDIGVLNDLYRQVGMTPPWKYNAVRDARTLYDIMPHQDGRLWVNPEADGVPHHPVTDCRVQIIRMWEHGFGELG